VSEPLAFALDALGSRGALVDPTPDGGLAVLPPELARSLGTREELALTPGAATPGLTGCGFGSPLLERLIQDARATVPVTWVRLDARAPSAGQATSAAGRVVLRNGLLEVVEATPGEALYLSAFFSVVAEADDRHEALFQVVLRAEGAAEPDPALLALLDPRRAAHRLVPTPAVAAAAAAAAASEAAPAEGGELAQADLAILVARARAAAEDLLAGFRDAVGRRFERDRTRLADYFGSLMADARAPRRSVAPEAVIAKLAHLENERRQKLADLEPRYALRATVTAAAFLCARVPATRVRLRARRRKAEGEIVVVVPAEVRAPDRLACAACHRTTLRPVVCDDRLHVLCETCAPSAQGRPTCAACRGKR
jgi:hypothetical protein